MMNSTVTNEDCMELMGRYPDGYFDLAVVDPPYGIGKNWNKDRKSKFYGHKNNFNNRPPDEHYFKELFRVSKRQIIWGCNYYWQYLTPSNSLIYWRKGKDAVTQYGSAGEIAWCSWPKYPLIEADILWNGCCMTEPTQKVHPHQKPVPLYRWTLQYFAEPGDKILDTHLGSGSSRIAAYDMGFDFTGCELDFDYYTAQEARFKAHIAKPQLFAPEQMYNFQQPELFTT